MVLIENLKLGIRYEEISIVNYDNEYASLLLTNMLKYMREIASKYPSNIKITDKEELL